MTEKSQSSSNFSSTNKAFLDDNSDENELFASNIILNPFDLQISGIEAAQLDTDKLAKKLGVNVRLGLSEREVDRRSQIIGFNELQSDPPDPIWKRYLEHFIDPMIILLMVSAGISILIGQFENACSILIASIIVVTVGFIQGYRSEKAIEALKDLMPPLCNCIRDGGLSKQIFARNIVPGDIIYLNIGDRVPADLRLFESNDLYIDESTHTGESEPVNKISQSITFDSSNLSKSRSFSDVESNDGSIKKADEQLISKNMVYMGTLVRCGSGKGIVTCTGSYSEFGKLAALMQSEESPRTPLQNNMDYLSKQLTIISFVVIAGIVLAGLIQRRPYLELFTTAVSLGVAAIPEGLPIVVTVTLALGQIRMARRNAIVTKLPAVESLGCVNVICSDKTGTLTKNEMTVVHLVTSDNVRAHVTGVGYSQMGDVIVETPNLPAYTVNNPNSAPISLQLLVEIGCVCNNASIYNGEVRGQPTEGALLCLASKMNMSDVRHQYTRLQEIPFSHESKFMKIKCAPIETDHTSFFNSKNEIIFLKGAIETVIKQCTHTFQAGNFVVLNEELEKRVLQEAAHLSRRGLRVLSMARSPHSQDKLDSSQSNLSQDSIVFYGLVGIMDPPREGVIESINCFNYSGLRVVMITGDSKDTACSIANQLGIYNSQTDICLSGDAVTEMSIDQLASRIKHCSVFYRTSPSNKVKIVKAFQLCDCVVVMTGDGVNDAVAVKSADIGIAMGKSGTDVCKQAGDIVLTDDDFSTILSAIEEGKCIFYNIRNFLGFQLSTSIAALSLIALAFIFHFPTPLNAMQILWINILMDGPPAQSLGVEPVDPDVVRQPPRKVSERILNTHLIINIVLAAIIMTFGTFIVYYNELSSDNRNTPRLTTMTFTCFVFFDMFNALSCRSQRKSIISIGILSNKFFLIAVSLSLLGQMAVVYFKPLQKVFQTESLSLIDLVYLLCISSSVFFIMEFKKIFLYHCECLSGTDYKVNNLVTKLSPRNFLAKKYDKQSNSNI